MSFPSVSFFLLLVGLQILAPLVWASRAEPIRVGGVYDSADGDDFLIGGGSAESAFDGVPVAGCGAVLVVVGFVAFASLGPAASPPYLAFRVRAPPVF
jgi:hypothetical protein